MFLFSHQALQEVVTHMNLPGLLDFNDLLYFTFLRDMKEIQLSVASVVCFVLFRVCNMWRVNSNNLRCSTKTPEVCNFLLWSLISVLCLHVDVLVDVCDGSQCLRGQEQLKGLAVNRPPWPRLPRWLMCPRQRSCPGLLCNGATKDVVRFVCKKHIEQ